MLIDELVEYLGMSRGDVTRVIETAPARYFVFYIDKRSGGKREIAQPARELKAMQRFILSQKLTRYTVHSCATAYMHGNSIAKNAEAHVNSSIVLKLDFERFFPSIRVGDWLKFARSTNNPQIAREDLSFYSKILFRGMSKGVKVPHCLSIGAPTSPALSNILLHSLDQELSANADRLQVNYTRYADDITVSGGIAAPILEFERLARRAVAKRTSPKLVFNDEKRRFCTKGGRRSVTGLIITPEQKISLGRERKRMISAMLHHLSLRTISDVQKAQLKGLLGFCIAVEASFIERLRVKYGHDLIDEALKFHIASKGPQR